jgi:hypothetical protein
VNCAASPRDRSERANRGYLCLPLEGGLLPVLRLPRPARRVGRTSRLTTSRGCWAAHPSPATQAITAQLIRRWQDDLRVGIAAMQQSGEIGSTLDPDRTAAAIIAGIQGGVAILMATGRIDHLTATLDSMLLLIRGSSRAEEPAR